MKRQSRFYVIFKDSSLPEGLLLKSLGISRLALLFCELQSVPESCSWGEGALTSPLYRKSSLCAGGAGQGLSSCSFHCPTQHASCGPPMPISPDICLLPLTCMLAQPEGHPLTTPLCHI